MSSSVENARRDEGGRSFNYGSIHVENEPDSSPEENLGVGYSFERPSVQATYSRLVTLVFGMVLGFTALASFLHADPNAGSETLSLSNTEAAAFQGKSFHKRQEEDGADDDSLYDEPHFIEQQVDNFDKHNHQTYFQRYFHQEKFFGGPGSPIIMVMGGEGPAFGLFYPFVHDRIAEEYNAYVVLPEHRFYGSSQPIEIKHNGDFLNILTPEQAMADALNLLSHTQKKLGCSLDRSSIDYCPVITVGGSYPGCLAALLRIAHPDKIDMAYASSAPLKLYAQDVNPDAYYERISEVADIASPGCRGAIQTTLDAVNEMALNTSDFRKLAREMNICVEDIPHYIKTREMFAQEMMFFVGTAFADANMGFYPMDEGADLNRFCVVFQNDELSNIEKMTQFFEIIREANLVDEGYEIRRHRLECFDVRSQLPSGKYSTISSADWSGVGNGKVGFTWDFQTCKDLVVQTGFSENSMFVTRPWTIEWMNDHCMKRFGVLPTPYRLLDKFHFEEENLPKITSHIIWTNGLHDGWSTAGFLNDLSPTMPAIIIPNGAHHSELRTKEDDYDEGLRLAQNEIVQIIGSWLDDLKEKGNDWNKMNDN